MQVGNVFLRALWLEHGLCNEWCGVCLFVGLNIHTRSRRAERDSTAKSSASLSPWIRRTTQNWNLKTEPLAQIFQSNSCLLLKRYKAFFCVCACDTRNANSCCFPPAPPAFTVTALPEARRLCPLLWWKQSQVCGALLNTRRSAVFRLLMKLLLVFLGVRACSVCAAGQRVGCPLLWSDRPPAAASASSLPVFCF